MYGQRTEEPVLEFGDALKIDGGPYLDEGIWERPKETDTEEMHPFVQRRFGGL